jgi:hypothetical protein
MSPQGMKIMALKRKRAQCERDKNPTLFWYYTYYINLVAKRGS